MSIAEAFSCTAATLLGGAVVIAFAPVFRRGLPATVPTVMFALGLACFIASAWTAALS